jgi:hypothetical protein
MRSVRRYVMLCKKWPLNILGLTPSQVASMSDIAIACESFPILFAFFTQLVKPSILRGDAPPIMGYLPPSWPSPKSFYQWRPNYKGLVCVREPPYLGIFPPDPPNWSLGSFSIGSGLAAFCLQKDLSEVTRHWTKIQKLSQHSEAAPTTTLFLSEFIWEL